MHRQLRIVNSIGLAILLASLAGLASADVFNEGPGFTSISLLPIGKPGNAADPATGFGSVANPYNIGKYEVTEKQYVDFLNATAKTDAHGLYAFGMFVSFAGTERGMFSHITQSGSPGNLSYSVPANYANLPMNYVSTASAMRFSNWLTNGQPTGAQAAGTTESGSYDLSGVNAGTQTLDQVTRSANANFVLPSLNEWYKAAYFNPTTASYFIWPTSSNSQPNGNLPDLTGNNANQNNGNGSLSGRTDVGSYVLTTSPSGTYDMAGNVYELTDSLYNGQAFALLGGAYPGNVGFPSIGPITTAGGGSPIMGFRIAGIAAVPEAVQSCGFRHSP